MSASANLQAVRRRRLHWGLMGVGSSTKHQLTVRAARSAAALHLPLVAAAAGTDTKTLLKALAALPARGDCARIAATLAHNGKSDIGLRHRALKSQAARPPLLRAATRYSNRPTLTAAGTGSAAWAGRRSFRLMSRWHIAIASEFDDPSTRKKMAERAESPVGFLRRLASDDAATVRAAVAERRDCPADVMSLLSADSAPRVRAAVARNPAAPESVLDSAPDDPNSSVREAAAQNERTSSAALGVLVKRSRSGAEVHWHAARHRNASPQMLRSLAQDRDGYTRQLAAANPNCSPEMVETFAASDDVWLRSGAADNPSTPAGLLQRLASDDAAMVRLCLARNRLCPPAVLVRLTNDADGSVSRAASANLAALDRASHAAA